MTNHTGGSEGYSQLEPYSIHSAFFAPLKSSSEVLESVLEWRNTGSPELNDDVVSRAEKDV